MQTQISLTPQAAMCAPAMHNSNAFESLDVGSWLNYLEIYPTETIKRTCFK
jgi:hypothetical protein